MLGKLIKHEFIFMIKDFTRTYIIYGAVVLILKLLLSIGTSSSNPSTSFVTLFTIFAVIYYIFTFVLALLTISHNVRRFKKNMFSHEGYLTNTLPVTPAQHVVAKVVVGLVNYILSFLVVFIGLEILLAGTGLSGYLEKTLEGVIEILDDFGLLFPTFLSMLTGYLALLLFCYLISSVTCMIGGKKSLGALLAIGLIIAYIFTVTMITAALADNGSDSENVLYIFSLFHGVIAAVEFAFVINIIKNKLNLQ
ncbi:MAG: hypothetical protein IJ060_06510 [Oscillospiraceae bacterium]|nr:hypothetical protein [Oscillospiraceae bacterium]